MADYMPHDPEGEFGHYLTMLGAVGGADCTAPVRCSATENATGTGQVTNLAGGSGSEFYSWSNGITTFTTPTVSSLSAGIWTATVTDALTACQISQVFQIIQPPALLISMSANSGTACPGGSVIVTGTASGGTPGDAACHRPKREFVNVASVMVASGRRRPKA